MKQEAVGYAEDTDCNIATTSDRGHGRIEKRKVFVTNNLDWLDSRKEWVGIRSMIEVPLNVFAKVKNKKKRDTTYRAKSCFHKKQLWPYVVIGL